MGGQSTDTLAGSEVEVGIWASKMEGKDEGPAG